MDLNIKGKYALITGGSHGIGLAIAQALAEEGCNVAICARGKERLSKAVLNLKKKDIDVIGISADVLRPKDIDMTVHRIVERWGTFHILINNVGGGGRWGHESVEDTPEDVWTDVYNKNAGAAIRFTRLIIPFMRKQKWGRVVTVSSICAREAIGRPWYIIAKGAEISLMKALAVRKDLARDGITFNTVAPGAIMIPDTGWAKEKEKDPEEFRKMVDKQFSLGRLGTPEEVANLVTFICSEKANLLNGAYIVIDGGESKGF